MSKRKSILTRLKVRLADRLHRLANKLDVEVTGADLSFVTTVELANEIQRRNDVTVILYGRQQMEADGKHWTSDGKIWWKMGRNDFVSMMLMIENHIGRGLFKGHWKDLGGRLADDQDENEGEEWKGK